MNTFAKYCTPYITQLNRLAAVHNPAIGIVNACGNRNNVAHTCTSYQCITSQQFPVICWKYTVHVRYTASV